MRPIEGATALLVIDIQERLYGAMPEAQRPRFHKAVDNLLALAAACSWPSVITEQYPRGLGPTLASLRESAEAIERCVWIEKLCFSACDADGVEEALAGQRAVVLVGLEAHVCVLETALGLIERGRRVLVPWDGVLSRDERDRQHALAAIRQAGGFVTSSETLIFQALGRAGTPLFKEMARRIR